MNGATAPADLDRVLEQMMTSQFSLVKQLRALEVTYPGQLHAATDITGFGLLGHIGEMIDKRLASSELFTINLKLQNIPILRGVLELIKSGHTSSIAPANRRALKLLDTNFSQHRQGSVKLSYDPIMVSSKDQQALLEVLVDPQTCGPILVSVAPQMAEALLRQNQNKWWLIGSAE